MPFSLLVNCYNQLTIYTIIGTPSFQECMATLKNFYEDKPTPNVLWDLKKASLALISSRQIKNIINSISPYADKRAGGKIAFIVVKDLECEMSKTIQTFYELKNVPVKVEIFQTTEGAMKWFDEEDNQYKKCQLF